MTIETRTGAAMMRTAGGAAERIAMANPQWSLALMLVALHAALAWGIEGWVPIDD